MSVSCVFFFFFFFFFLLWIYYSFLWGIDSSFSVVRVWVSSFECGFLANRIVEDFFSGTYLGLLVFFVIFDLEVSLLLNFPFQGLGFKNLFCYFLFIVFLSIGFFIEIYSGYVSWGF